MVSKKLFFVSFVLLVALSMSVIDAAAADKVVRLGKVSADEGASDTMVLVNLELKSKISDTRVFVSIPDSGFSARKNVDFSKTNKKAVHLLLPPVGGTENYVKIEFNSDQGRRIRYRPLIQ